MEATVLPLAAGDRVTVYADPRTETRPEGTATLVAWLGQNVAVEYWQVRFDGQAETCRRIIKKRAANAEVAT